ncbi:hypothetical protein [Streptococcus vestibularis]|jgi:hypothetical protein|uniref:Uncharacterized protein n=1 Tax=Streptococcus salivarius TaxID=1304 RepID=H2D771_STRSL|nr:hypothetical protein [Streptococcus vestibularis]AEX55176.1 hypothetical protein [Streptococcus salivarius]
MAKKKPKTIEELRQEFDEKREEQNRLKQEQKEIAAQINALEKEEERSDFETIGRLYYEMRKRDNNELDRKELLSSMNQKVHGNEGSRNQ